MKMIYVILFIISFSIVAVEKPKKEKTFTQAEVDEIVLKETLKKIQRVRGNNISSLSEELFKKEKDLLALKEKMIKREEQLKMNEQSFAEKVVEFKTDQQKLLGCASQNKKDEQTRLNHLVQVIAGMRPANAAKILSVQEPRISVKLIEKIDPTKASKIFNLMDKEISARLQKQFLSMKK